MRDIKFRAWDQKNKLMVEDYGVDTEWGHCSLNGLLRGEQYDNAEDLQPIFMQNTGLKDKNGVEIYEGDIVTDNRGKKFEVRWNDLYAAFGLKDYTLGKESAPLRGLHPSSQIEVIGNVYENPELLK